MCWTSHPSACAQLMLQVHRGLTEAVEAGNSVLIIEHNPDIVKVADWLIDLGPEGGDRGGELIAEGTPEQIIKVKQSYTGQFLKAHRR